jgi:hypothetical protein
MKEKTGNIEKIKYDFDTARNLEIFLPNLNGWYRVTSREFRSFNGKRRIQNIKYKGPVYLYNTNKRANKSLYEKDKIVEHNWKSYKRPNETF